MLEIAVCWFVEMTKTDKRCEKATSDPFIHLIINICTSVKNLTMEMSICQGRGGKYAKKTDAHVEVLHNCYKHGHTDPEL